MLPVDDKAFGQQEEEHSSALALVIRGEIHIWPINSFFMDKFSSISFLVVDLTGTQISTHLQMARNLTMLRSLLQRGSEHALTDVLWGSKQSHLGERNSSTGRSASAEEDNSA